MFLTTALFSTLALSASVTTPISMQDSGDWPGWRGHGGNGVASGSLPLEWSEDKNVRWKTEIPGKGISSPVAFNGVIKVPSESLLPVIRMVVSHRGISKVFSVEIQFCGRKFSVQNGLERLEYRIAIVSIQFSTVSE